jgi:hypothetical protein
MRKLASFLRLLPLAAAAFASVATSAMIPTLQLDDVTPRPDETAVDPASELTVRGVLQEGGDVSDSPAGLGLRTLAGQEIAGATERRALEGGLTYTFKPAAPLAPDSYELYWVGSPGGSAYFTDSDLATLVAAYPNDGVHEPIVRFSTVSQPRVRYAFLYASTSYFRISFSEDMDESTLEHVKVLDATGDVLPVTARWLGGPMHELTLQAPAGAVTLAFEPGLLAATGVDVAPTPFTLVPERR